MQKVVRFQHLEKLTIVIDEVNKTTMQAFKRLLIPKKYLRQLKYADSRYKDLHFYKELFELCPPNLKCETMEGDIDCFPVFLQYPVKMKSFKFYKSSFAKEKKLLDYGLNDNFTEKVEFYMSRDTLRTDLVIEWILNSCK